MEIKNCKGCGRLFQYIGGMPLCPACRDALEDKFVEVKDFIYENKGCSIAEASEATGVSTKQIKQWIKEDRLILSEPTEDGITCEQCNTPICSGRFCEKCKTKMLNELGSVTRRTGTVATDKKVDKSGSKMRFLS